MGYLKRQLIWYAQADEKMRKMSKEHWLKVYAESLEQESDSGLAARVLANMAIVDAGMVTVEGGD